MTLSSDRCKRLRHGIRTRHARKVRELIDELSQTVGLLHDRPAALIEDRVEIRSALRVFFPQPFGGELDGRERIFELVSDPPGHILPGLRLLRAEQLRQIVKGDDRSDRRPAAVPQRA